MSRGVEGGGAPGVGYFPYFIIILYPTQNRDPPLAGSAFSTINALLGGPLNESNFGAPPPSYEAKTPLILEWRGGPSKCNFRGPPLFLE